MSRLKIVIPYGMKFIPVDVIERHEGEVYVVKYGGDLEGDELFHTIYVPNLDIDEASESLVCDRYNQLLEMSEEIDACFDMDDDNVLVITDGTSESMLIAKYLQKKITGNNGDLHLWAFLPISFTDSQKMHNKEYMALLEELTEIKSLVTTNLNEFVMYPNKELNFEEIGELACEITGVMLDAILSQLPSVIRHKKAYKYFFDNNEKRYVAAGKLWMVEKEYVHRRLMGRCAEMGDYEKTKRTIEIISSPRVRIDGKDVCRELRRLRQEFATANNLNYEFRVCTYEGPCAGTCDYCDSEVKELYKLALAKSDGNPEKVIFPKTDLQGKFDKANKTYNDRLMWMMGEVMPRTLYKTSTIDKKEWNSI